MQTEGLEWTGRRGREWEWTSEVMLIEIGSVGHKTLVSTHGLGPVGVPHSGAVGG